MLDFFGGITSAQSVLETLDKRTYYAHFLEPARHDLFRFGFGYLTVGLYDEFAGFGIDKFVHRILGRFLIEYETV